LGEAGSQEKRLKERGRGVNARIHEETREKLKYEIMIKTPLLTRLVIKKPVF